jgi:hypothetical protein
MPKPHIRIIRAIYFSLAIGVFPILALWKNNLGELNGSALIRPLLISILFILLTLVLGLLLGRTWEKAALFSALASLFAFSYGHVYNLVGTKVILGISVGYVKLLVVYLVVFAVLVFLLLRMKKINGSIFLFGNILGTVLLLMNIMPAVNLSWQTSQNKSEVDEPISVPTSSAGEELPDVYFIVLDMYARADIMQEVTGYDNSAFISALQERGFYIPDCAHSNYSGTVRSMTTALNMDYLETLGLAYKDANSTSAETRNLIVNNRIRSVMQGYGYEFVTGRGYDSSLDINNPDIYLNYWQDSAGSDDLDEQRFADLYFNTTILRVVSELYKNNPEKADWLPYWLVTDREADAAYKEAAFWYYQNNYMFDSLESIPQMPGNYFVYAHINAPHGPYAYRADGSFNFPPDSDDELVLFTEAVQYLNTRVLDLIDTLQNESDVPPIIILQGDHSIHVFTTGIDKHKILNAYYLPGDLITPPYATITPVNNFRLVIRNYFDPSMELLPDYLFVKYTNDPEQVEATCELDSN